MTGSDDLEMDVDAFEVSSFRGCRLDISYVRQATTLTFKKPLAGKWEAGIISYCCKTYHGMQAWID
jgi:hypothetical protein